MVNPVPFLDWLRNAVSYARKTGLVFFALPAIAGAHQVSSVSLIAYFETGAGTYTLDAAMEVVPSEDQEVNDEISPEDAAREFAVEYLTVLFDEEEVEPELDISIVSASDEDTPEELQRQQVLVKLDGEVPEEAEEFLLYLDPSCPMAVVMVVVKDDRPSRRMQVILAGEYSRPVNVLPVVEGDPFEEAGSGEEPTADSDSGETVVDADLAANGEGDSAKSATSGVGGSGDRKSPFLAGWAAFFGPSLVPALLVLCLFLVTPKRRPVFVSTAAFLVGLSLVIALRSWGALPAVSWIGGAAGILVAVLSLEALFHPHFRWWRVVLLASGGLVSGWIVTEAGGFRETVILADEALRLPATIQFVLGAEVGAILGGAVAGALLILLARFDWYRRSVLQPLAILVAGYGIFLAVGEFLR